jgi:RNA polymerase sigma-70 factor (ECF subfamily)
MDGQQVLAQRFEAERPRLVGVAQRMLGSASDSQDAVQEAWLRLTRVDADGLDNLCGWLTTVVGRICLDMLRSRTSRREEPTADAFPEAAAQAPSPEQEAVLADTVGLALLVVLETLTPAERLAFVLHDLFAVSFEEIAEILERTPAAARQLASRARRRVQGDPIDLIHPPADLSRKWEVVEAFLAAVRNGEFAALLELLDPDVVLRSDAAAVAMGGPAQTRGARAVAALYNGRAQAAREAWVDALPGAVVVIGGQIRIALAFTVRDGRIIGIEAMADPEQIAALDLQEVAG